MSVDSLDQLYPLRHKGDWRHPNPTWEVKKQRLQLFYNSLHERLNTLILADHLEHTERFEGKHSKLFSGIEGVSSIVGMFAPFLEIAHHFIKEVPEIISPFLEIPEKLTGGAKGIHDLAHLKSRIGHMTPGEHVGLVGHAKTLFIETMCTKLTINFQREIVARDRAKIVKLAHHYAKTILALVHKETKKKPPSNLGKLTRSIIKHLNPNPIETMKQLLESYQNRYKKQHGHGRFIISNFMKIADLIKGNPSVAKTLFLWLPQQPYDRTYGPFYMFYSLHNDLGANLNTDSYLHLFDVAPTARFRCLGYLWEMGDYSMKNQYHHRHLHIPLKTKSGEVNLLESFICEYSTRDRLTSSLERSLYRTCGKILQLLIRFQIKHITTRQEKAKVSKFVKTICLTPQLKKIHQILARFHTRITRLEKNQLALQKKVDWLEAKVETVDRENQRLKKEVSQMKEQVEKLDNR